MSSNPFLSASVAVVLVSSALQSAVMCALLERCAHKINFSLTPCLYSNIHLRLRGVRNGIAAEFNIGTGAV
jgi:hypothetical protein